MLLEILQNFFDENRTPQHARQEVARQISRYILGIESSIPTLSKVLRELLSDDHVSSIATEIRRLAWDRHIMTHYWRAVSAYLDTRDTHHALELDVPVHDVYHMISVLNNTDFEAYSQQTRDWRRPVISDKDTSSTIEKLKRPIQNSVNMLAWVWNTDTGITEHDWISFMQTESLRLIYRYESECSIVFLLHKCQSHVHNQACNLIKKYESPSHALFIPEDDVTTCVKDLSVKEKVQTRKEKEKRGRGPRVPARMSIVTKTDDGDDIDVLSVHGHVHPSCESEVVASVFISKIAKQRPHVGRYLSIVVNGVDPQSSYYDYETAFAQTDIAAASKCCGLTKDDLAWLRSQALHLKPA